MAVNRHSIFRDKALKHYTQSRKKDILPNFGSIPVALFFWIMFFALIATLLLLWYTQVPLYANGSGIIAGTNTHTKAGSTVALIFFAPGEAPKLRAGMPIELNLGTLHPHTSGIITVVEPGLKTPAQILKSYGLNAHNSYLDQPAVIALVRLDPAIASSFYAGSALSAQVKIGTKSLFSALTGI